MDAIKAVSDLTRYDFEKVYNMAAVEFFAYIQYINFDRKREERRIKSLMKKK